MMKTRAVVVKKDENGKRVYELRESVRGTSENLQDLELALVFRALTPPPNKSPTKSWGQCHNWVEFKLGSVHTI